MKKNKMKILYENWNKYIKGEKNFDEVFQTLLDYSKDKKYLNIRKRSTSELPQENFIKIDVTFFYSWGKIYKNITPEKEQYVKEHIPKYFKDFDARVEVYNNKHRQTIYYTTIKCEIDGQQFIDDAKELEYFMNAFEIESYKNWRNMMGDEIQRVYGARVPPDKYGVYRMNSKHGKNKNYKNYDTSLEDDEFLIPLEDDEEGYDEF